MGAANSPVDWLAVPIGTEAELDAAEQAAALEAQAEAKLPHEAPRDLFGDAIDTDTAKGRKIQSARQAVRWFRRKMALAGIHPLDVMARGMMEAVQRGDWETAHRRATDLAPYMAPRLSVMALPGAAPAAAGAGLLRFTWEATQDAPPAIGHEP